MEIRNTECDVARLFLRVKGTDICSGSCENVKRNRINFKKCIF